MNKRNLLSTAEMKKVLGGNVPVPPSYCEVSCDMGQFACCNSDASWVPVGCECWPNDEALNVYCENGGLGHATCWAGS